MDNVSQVTVRLVSSLGAKFRVPESQMTVPANVTRYGLSTIINHILQLDAPKVFDIILDGELLRQTLGEALLARSISTESTIQLEYTFLVTPPTLADTAPQQDWIRSIACVPKAFVCCGTAAGQLVLHTADGVAPAGTSEAHSGGVTALCAHAGGPRFTGPLEGPLAVSGGQDCSACVWSLREDHGPAAALRLEGHTDAVSAVAANDASVATGAWDCTVRLWPWHRLYATAAEGGDGEAERTEKRKKLAAGAVSVAAAVPLCECAAVLVDHSQVVTGVAWAGHHHLYSSSLDHSIKRWDVASGVAVDTMATGKALLCCTGGHEEAGRPAVVAVGGTDGALRWWDCRQSSRSTEALALRAFKAHSAPVSAVAWRPGSDFQVASVSHDSLLRLWDMRTAVPLATIDNACGQKLFAMGWGQCSDGSVALATGGEDAILRVHVAPEAGTVHSQEGVGIE